MFISDLSIITPTNDNLISGGDNEINTIKLAIKNTFKVFTDGPMLYSPIELLGIYSFITADSNNFIWVGSISTGERNYIIAIDENKVFYARAPKSMWGTIFYSDIPQDKMDILFPSTYRICNGDQISQTTLNKIMSGNASTVITLPNLVNHYIKGAAGTEAIGAVISEDVRADIDNFILKLDTSKVTLAEGTHNHGSGTIIYASPPKNWQCGSDDGGDNECDVRNTPGTQTPGKDSHSHTFNSLVVESTTNSAVASINNQYKTAIGNKNVVRPKTYNLYAYTRIN